MGEYVTLEEFKNNSELVGFNFADYDAQLAISAASAGIEQYCGRTFDLSASTTVTRYYTPNDTHTLNINDIVTTNAGATVQVDQNGDGTFEFTWTLNKDYLLEPLNAQADGWPYQSIRIHPNSSQMFPCYPRSVLVTGQYGWPTVPATIKQATMIMAVRLMKRAREAPFGVVGLGLDNAPVRITRVDPDTAFMLDPFIKGSGVLVG